MDVLTLEQWHFLRLLQHEPREIRGAWSNDVAKQVGELGLAEQRGNAWAITEKGISYLDTHPMGMLQLGD